MGLLFSFFWPVLLSSCVQISHLKVLQALLWKFYFDHTFCTQTLRSELFLIWLETKCNKTIYKLVTYIGHVFFASLPSTRQVLFEVAKNFLWACQHSRIGNMDPAGEIKDAPLIPTSTAQPLKKPHSVTAVHLSLVTVQLGYAGLQIFSRVALVAGLNQFLFSMYRNIIAFLLLAPFAYFHERLVKFYAD